MRAHGEADFHELNARRKGNRDKVLLELVDDLGGGVIGLEQDDRSNGRKLPSKRSNRQPILSNTGFHQLSSALAPPPTGLPAATGGGRDAATIAQPLSWQKKLQARHPRHSHRHGPSWQAAFPFDTVVSTLRGSPAPKRTQWPELTEALHFRQSVIVQFLQPPHLVTEGCHGLIRLRHAEALSPRMAAWISACFWSTASSLAVCLAS